MNRSEYEQELEDIKKRVKKLEQVKIEEDIVWKPKNGEKYYIVSDNGLVHMSKWLDYNGDELRFGFCNVFKTQEEAEFESERLKVYRKLRQFALNRGRHVGCFCILYDYVNKEIEYTKNETGFTKYGDLFFKTEEVARRAVETVGAEKVLKYYLEV